MWSDRHQAQRPKTAIKNAFRNFKIKRGKYMSYFRASATVSGEYLTVNWNASVSSDISGYSIYYEIYINDSKEYESE